MLVEPGPTTRTSLAIGLGNADGGVSLSEHSIPTATRHLRSESPSANPKGTSRPALDSASLGELLELQADGALERGAVEDPAMDEDVS
jgi:hypothetical protein